MEKNNISADILEHVIKNTHNLTAEKLKSIIDSSPSNNFAVIETLLNYSIKNKRIDLASKIIDLLNNNIINFSEDKKHALLIHLIEFFINQNREDLIPKIVAISKIDINRIKFNNSHLQIVAKGKEREISDDTLLTKMIKSRKLEIIEQLIKNNDINLNNAILGCYKGDMSVVREPNKSVNLRKIYTPLQLAIKLDYAEIVKIIIENDVNKESLINKNIQELVAHYQTNDILYNSHTLPTPSLKKIDITALHLAIKNTNYEITKILVDNGADINLKNKNGDNVLMLILQKNNLTSEDYQIVNLFLENENLDLSTVNNFGEDALIICMRSLYKTQKRKNLNNDNNLSNSLTQLTKIKDLLWKKNPNLNNIFTAQNHQQNIIIGYKKLDNDPLKESKSSPIYLPIDNQIIKKLIIREHIELINQQIVQALNAANLDIEDNTQQKSKEELNINAKNLQQKLKPAIENLALSYKKTLEQNDSEISENLQSIMANYNSYIAAKIFFYFIIDKISDYFDKEKFLNEYHYFCEDEKIKNCNKIKALTTLFENNLTIKGGKKIHKEEIKAENTAQNEQETKNLSTTLFNIRKDLRQIIKPDNDK